ncbi:glyoxalase [Arthrobacter sp. Soil736]|uniref:VOC family protein n=1 Tax=Arthrobacter sp. Soil736 TaxID=1736395 RepID=UPI0006FE43C2|nr:VOC family protein [Arthrobacter sp. Soil736]KRE64100.1 glyoxalase [Arthrobacter sp. Soil736]
MEQQREVTRRTYPSGVPCWVDTLQPDVEAAIDFYGGLFGWEFEDAAPSGAAGRYVIAKLDGQEAGAIAGPGTGVPAWHTYVSVEDADAAARHLLKVGATLKSAPADAGNGGVQAVLADPEGAEFRIWQARERPGAQAVNVPGGWNFSDLHTTDTEAAAAFYTRAFDWQFDHLDFGTMIRRPGYGDHLEATVDPNIRVRQSGDAVPRGFEDAVAWLVPAAPGERPQWHVTFTVADRDSTAKDAERLGARILGQDDTEWTRTVLIRDPGGAVFTASQFTPPTG